VSRLRVGEWLAAIGAIGLLVVLFFDWFGVEVRPPEQPLDGGGSLNLLHIAITDEVHQTGWASLGWFMDVLLVVVILGGLSIAYMTLRRTSPAWPVGASVLTIAGGGLTFLVLLVRVLTQPGLGVGLGNDEVTLQFPAYLGLLFASLIPVGAFAALKDERLDAPESAYTPPPARPIPGT
jgi:hypothetical protein